MNMFRGAFTFLVIVAVVVVVECKKQESTNVVTQTAERNTQTAAGLGPVIPASRTPCKGVSAKMLCATDPCTATVDVKAHTVTFKTAGGPSSGTLYVATQKSAVNWVGTGDPDSKLEKVFFSDPTVTEATCSTGTCAKTFADASDCIPYKYTVHPHNTGLGDTDPDVEVGTTTGTGTMPGSREGSRGETATH